MSSRKVMKFGGAALADGPAVERSCRIVRERGGANPIVVVSAHQGVTSLLDSVARAAAGGAVDVDRVRIRHKGILRQLGLDMELLNRYFAELASLLELIRARGNLLPGERDLVLSFGERMSARVVAHALKRAGVQATPVDAFDLGLTTDSNHGSARPLPGSGTAVREALRQVPGIPVVTGFLAQDRLGNLTTLGRNGSDLTASLVAEAVGAGELELWKAVGGMMTADPAIVPDARILERLSFEEAGELASHGAEVLHPEALVPAQRAAITVRFLDVSDPDGPGTTLVSTQSAEGPVAIAARRRLLRIILTSDGSAAFAGRLGEVGGILARHAVEPAAFDARGARIELLLVPGPATDAVLAEIGRSALVEKDLALVAVVGRPPGDALGVLAGIGVPVREAVMGSERASQVFLLHADDLERAVRGLHAALLAPRAVPVP
jgi:aspartate kinase